METFGSKNIFFRKLIVILSTILILSTIAFPIYSHADMVNDPETDYLNVNSPIVLEFESPIEWNTSIPYYASPFTSTPSIAHDGITLTDNSTSTSVLIDIGINGSKLIITPDSALKKNTEYKLEITDHVVLKLDSAGSDDIRDNQVLDSTVSTAAPQSFDIKTGFLTFGNLMSGSNAEINDIITDYTPRRINVTAPIRYIDELKIIHKRQASVQSNTTESVTNIDISVNDKAIDNTNGDVKSISVTPIVNGAPLPQQAKEIDHLNAVQNDGKKLYDFGFTQLPDTSAFDIEVILYDDNNIPLDVRVVKVPFESKDTTTITQKDRYRLAGKTFTLYQLLDKPKDLQTLLDENRMDELRVQVVQ